jgi:hypothetical protein
MQHSDAKEGDGEGDRFGSFVGEHLSSSGADRLIDYLEAL